MTALLIIATVLAAGWLSWTYYRFLERIDALEQQIAKRAGSK